MSRIEQLKTMLANSPDDTFLQYALAMELGNDEQHDASFEIYSSLMKETPPYVPAFFMCAQQLAGLDREEEAIEILRAGIDQATLQNDSHAAAEMQAFMESIS